MKARRLLALSILAITFGCEGHQSPTAPGAVKSVPLDSSAVLSDGAHGGNPDFFFLPPLVPLPFHNPNFELGKFNNTLKPSLKIDICELVAEPLNALPKPATACAGTPIKTFAPGSVQLVNLPLRQWGWWAAFRLPPDGFYYVLWDTRQAGLNASKYYRIKVFIDGSTVPIGYADVDPMSSLREWRYALTGEVIQLVNGWLLPIPFRVENGALCGGAISCTSETVSNTNPGGSKVVQVIGNAGVPVAGAKFPDGWLGPDPTRSVVVTISSVNTGPDNADRTEGTPCHATLDLQQFRSCFKFTTTPVLPFIPDTRKQFYVPVTVAVCFTLQDSGDPREKFAELYASNPPTEPPHALTDASDLGILGLTGRNCGTNRYGVRSSNPVAQFASAGWGKLKEGLDHLFGVKTAYAIDVGLGGLLDGFSNVGPALTAVTQRYTNTGMTFGPGATTTSTARIVGNSHHSSRTLSTGIGGLYVTFSIEPGKGGLRLIGSEAPAVSVLLSLTNTQPYDPESPTSGGGFAPVNWTMPQELGTVTLTALGPKTGPAVTFKATVVSPDETLNTWGPTERRMLSMQTGATYQVHVLPPNTVASWLSSDPSKVQVSPTGLITAVVGGENIAGGADASITSVLSTESAGPSMLVNSFLFHIFPRVTTLAWNAVEGAVSYHVVSEFGNGSATNPFCTVPAECGVWTERGMWTPSYSPGTTITTGLTHTFEFVGQQPGRWRVFALRGDGTVISTSPYVYFAYTI